MVHVLVAYNFNTMYVEVDDSYTSQVLHSLLTPMGGGAEKLPEKLSGGTRPPLLGTRQHCVAKPAQEPTHGSFQFMCVGS